MNIAQIRKAKGLSQQELADMADMTQAHVSRAENGNDGVTLGALKAIAAALDVSLADLFTEGRAPIEQNLVEAYRRLSPGQQRGWMDMALMLLSEDQPPNQETASADRQTFPTKPS